VKFKLETEFQDTEIGEIPKDWKIVKLGNVAKYVKGKKPKNLFEEKIDNDLLPYLTAEYMRGLEKPKWCDPKLEKSIIKVSSDDIIMIWDGSYAGYVFIGFEGILASTMVKITPIRDIEKRFLFYYLAMNYKKLRETTIGTGIPHINKKVFEEFPIPLPPVDEQRRIAEILATIDKTIELHHEEKARLDRLKRGLMDLLLTGRVRVVG
jgi:type I restriction enzyme S subunit